MTSLVFPVGTGDRNYIGSAVETIEGLRLVKQALPQCKTVLGVSNVSFGLPAAGREVLNSGHALPLRASRPGHGHR